VSAAERLALAYVADHPEAAARLLERIDPPDAAALLASLPAAMSAAVYGALGPSTAAACAAALADDVLAALLGELPLDVAGAALRQVEPARHEGLLAKLADERRGALGAMLAYPEHSAGALADPLVLALPDDSSVADAQRQLRRAAGHRFPTLYIVARDRTLVGVLAIHELMAARPRETLAAVMQRDVTWLDAYTDLATVAVHPAWDDFDALPVVDGARRLVGAIRYRTLRRIHRERARPMMATIVGLTELYWAGLAGMLTSLAPPQTPTGEASDVA